MKKFLAILAAAIINTPVLFAGAHVNIPIDHLVDGMPVVFMVTRQKITPHNSTLSSRQSLTDGMPQTASCPSSTRLISLSTQMERLPTLYAGLLRKHSYVIGEFSVRKWMLRLGKLHRLVVLIWKCQQLHQLLPHQDNWAKDRSWTLICATRKHPQN